METATKLKRSSAQTPSHGWRKMRKKRLKKSLEALIEKAEDCADLAKVQRAGADKQHESAHKLEMLGHALQADVAAIKSDMEKDTEQVAGSTQK